MEVFYGQALKGKPESVLEQPLGLVTVKIDPETGLIARSGQKNSIYEIFREENVPTKIAPSPNMTGTDDSTLGSGNELF